jgi:outer membrane immunogenic protein
MVKFAVPLLALLTAFGIPAHAQESKSDVFFGYSLFHANPATSGAKSVSLNGGAASYAYNFTHSVAVVGEFAGYGTSNFDFGTIVTTNGTTVSNVRADDSIYTLLFGPRFSYHRFQRFTPFGQVLIGTATGNQDLIAPSSVRGFAHETGLPFALAVGGGVDARINNHFSARLGQLEYLMTRFSEFATTVTSSGPLTQNNLRYSAGIVIHF